jgi:hypothetical protein
MKPSCHEFAVFGVEHYAVNTSLLSRLFLAYGDASIIGPINLLFEVIFAPPK